MECDCYTYASKKGEVRICRNEERPWRWDVWVGGKLICPAYYRNPHEAGFFASRHDFGDPELNEQYIGLRVPQSLESWKPCVRSEVKLSFHFYD